MKKSLVWRETALRLLLFPPDNGMNVYKQMETNFWTISTFLSLSRSLPLQLLFPWHSLLTKGIEICAAMAAEVRGKFNVGMVVTYGIHPFSTSLVSLSLLLPSYFFSQFFPFKHSEKLTAKLLKSLDHNYKTCSCSSYYFPHDIYLPSKIFTE